MNPALTLSLLYINPWNASQTSKLDPNIKHQSQKPLWALLNSYVSCQIPFEELSRTNANQSDLNIKELVQLLHFQNVVINPIFRLISPFTKHVCFDTEAGSIPSCLLIELKGNFRWKELTYYLCNTPVVKFESRPVYLRECTIPLSDHCV